MTEAIRLSDERLAWLAAKEYCTRKANSHRPAYWFFVIITAGRVAWTRHAIAREKLLDYGVAVDDLARRLTADERITLRTKAILPDWFLPAVDVEVVKVRKARTS